MISLLHSRTGQVIELAAGPSVRDWHLASFRCDAEFGPLSGGRAYRTSSSNQARFMDTRPSSDGNAASAPLPTRSYAAFRFSRSSSRPVSSISVRSQIEPGSICARVG
jgi:hypothetical protein